MFNEVDSKQETLILAEAEKKSRRKGPDFTIRTVTHWHTLQHHTNFCSVPSHYDNVPDTDFNGEKYDKYPSRMCVTIDGYEVCRWCFIAEGDVLAIADGVDPVERTEENSGSSN
jgi:hypothetical protein